MSDVDIAYVIVTPVRDEEQYLPKTLESVLRQTVLPKEWIIVDDGSRDGTLSIAREFAGKHPWVKVVARSDRGRRVPGAGVMEAFYDGYGLLTCSDWGFIVKLDGDVGLTPTYFADCFEQFRRDPKLGMCGGVMFRLEKGIEVLERHPLMHVRGPIKLYRRECWDAINGLIVAPGWDTVDEIHANYCGWRTRTFREVEAIHYRATGAVQGAWRDAVKNGVADYISGYHPLFMAAKCVHRLFRRPYGRLGLGLAYGYTSAWVRRTRRPQDVAIVRYFRRQQIRRLLHLRSIWTEE